jgi:CRP-like cAMP-binding protein
MGYGKNEKQPVDWEGLCAGISSGKSNIEYGASRKIFSQGEAADSVFYLQRGKVKLSVIFKGGERSHHRYSGRRSVLRRGMPRGSRVADGYGYRNDRLHAGQD